MYSVLANADLGTNITSGQIPVSWIIGAICAFAGWKLVKFTSAKIKDAGSNLGYGMIAASIMSIIGLGGAGFSWGDLSTRETGDVQENSFVKHQGAIAQLDKDENVIYPVGIDSKEQKEKWKNMSKDEKRFVWSVLRGKVVPEKPELLASEEVSKEEEKPNSEAVEATEAYDESLEDPFAYDDLANDESLAPPQVLDNPMFPKQVSWATLLMSMGLIGSGVVTFMRRVGNGKYNTPRHA